MILHDIRFALRQLRKSPGFSLTAVATLAFGIGATTAIFSIVEGVLLRPLPFADPSRLVVLGDRIDGAGDSLSTPVVSAPEVPIYVRGMQSSVSMGAYAQTGYELSGLGEPAQVSASRLTAATFSVLGISPMLGRTFTEKEDEGKAQLVVLSYQTWRSRFHGDANILGQKILLDRKPYEIVGVMPRQFEFPLVPGQLNRSELWVPMSFSQAEAVQYGSWNYSMVGRLNPGVSAAQALQAAQRTAAEIQHNFPPALGNVTIHAAIDALDESTVGQARPMVRTLFLAVTVVLFIACANLAGLLLVRVIRRRREMAVRLALGARKASILGQNLIETLVLSIGGGLLGLVLTAAALRVGVSLLPLRRCRVSTPLASIGG